LTPTHFAFEYSLCVVADAYVHLSPSSITWEVNRRTVSTSLTPAMIQGCFLVHLVAYGGIVVIGHYISSSLVCLLSTVLSSPGQVVDTNLSLLPTIMWLSECVSNKKITTSVLAFTCLF